MEKGKEKHNISKTKQKNSYSEKLKKAKMKHTKASNSAVNDKSSTIGTPSNGRGKQRNQNNGNKIGHGSFPEYMQPLEVLKGLKEESLIEGTLRINPKNYEDAFISSPAAKDQDIYIKGIVARNRAFNGDIVVVSLESPDKWKVNHGAIQDYIEMNASEEEKRILMKDCIVNVKQEPSDNSKNKFVNSNINISSVEKLYKAKTDKGGVEVVDISSDNEAGEKAINNDAVSAEVIQKSVDPLLDVPEASASDYESDVVEEIEENICELDNELKNLNIGSKIPNIIDVDNTDSDDEDVVVETSLDDLETTYETAAETTIDLNTTNDSVSTSSSKRTRRGRRNKNKNNKDENNTFGGSTSSSSRRMTVAKPLVEYNILSVLKCAAWPKQGFVQKTGKVVSIKEYKHSRLAAGFIKPMSDNNPNFFLFSPTDSRIPRLKISMREAPDNFKSRPELFDGVMFMASVIKWDKVSMALGKLERSLGHSSDIGVRTEAILLENNIDFADFPEEVLRDLPPDYETWSVSETEIKKRRDFRDECVFTIDPATARDLDDALSVKVISDGHYRVGVHIADVSHFVRSGSSLDRAALSRATSTYLVERVVPMLPRPLCEKLCSLNPHENRLTFSVEWEMNDKAEILSEWFGRSVIRSCAKLAYEDAQCLIDDKDLTGVDVAKPHTLEDVSRSVKIMNMLAVQLREKREQRGALRLDQPKLCFTLNKETGLPDGFKLHEHRLSNKMIEEFMLLANMAVARKIYTSFPKVAVLRRHPDPKIDMMDKIVEQLGFLGIKIDGLTSSALATSIDRLKEHGDTDKLACVTSLLSKPMELARYFCTGMMETHLYHHYALNVPLYTHFTSPIRRYPDILVHRLLDMAVRDRQPDWSTEEVEKAAQHCNDRRLAAKKVGEASAEMFLALFIKECGPLTQAGVVTGVMDHSLDVLITEMGVVKRVYMDRCGVSRHKFRRISGVSYVDMFWEDGTKLVLTILSRVRLLLSRGDKDFEFIAAIEKPEKADDAEPDVITLE